MMDLTKLFETQKPLDELIVREKGLEGRDLLSEKILALQVELGELANEWRGFKFWSENQEPRTSEIIECPYCIGTGDSNAEANMEQMMEGNTGYPYEACEECGETGVAGYRNPLLEEYVDCLHFILSIGNLLRLEQEIIINADFIEQENVSEERITSQFNDLFYWVSHISSNKDDYYDAAIEFLNLGEMLGFTWEQIETAYYEKNKINHEHQADGY